MQNEVEKKPFSYYIEEFGQHFQFEKVHKAMLSLNWCWNLGTDELGNDNMGIPSIQTIKNHAYKLLKDAYDNGNGTGCGGFVAGWDGEEMFLTFLIEEWQA